MSKKQSEKFDFDVLQKKEIERINALKDNPKYKKDKESLRIKQVLYDGYVGTKEEFENGSKIMIIAAEAHDLKYYDENSSNNDVYDGFYVKEVAYTGDPKYYPNGKRFMDHLLLIYKYIIAYDMAKNNTATKLDINFVLNDLSKNYNDLKEIAFINLKKIGGSGRLNYPETKAEDGVTFYQWVKYHRKDLINQINDINPKYIVLCSVPVQNAYNKQLSSEIEGQIDIFNSYHPSIWNKKTEDYIKNIKLQ